MDEQPLEDTVAQLWDESDWLIRGMAVRRLTAHGEAAIPWLDRVFDLTFDSKAPVQDNSRVLIKRLGPAAVPFLLEKLDSEEPAHRKKAVSLLMECGNRHCTTTRLVEQVLEERDPNLPNWGRDPENIFQEFRKRLQDSDMGVRFAAASALEEFGCDITATIPVFVEILVNASDNDQNWAALRLGRIGEAAKDACRALSAAARSKCEYTRLAARNALAIINCE